MPIENLQNSRVSSGNNLMFFIPDLVKHDVQCEAAEIKFQFIFNKRLKG